MPLSVSGSLFASLNIIPIIKKNYKKSLYFSSVALFIILKYNIFSEIILIGFGGILIEICSILLFIIFYSLPLNHNISPIFIKFINQLTNYTQGIYSLHLIIKKGLYTKVNLIKNGNFSGCFLIFVLSFFVSIIGEKITKNSKLYLFI